ncbi:TlpA family protein disulfide reductase [Streptacidiphilus sp. 4-A2]|nr:TlpA family protein disulfide reductase [Streptacidiphilus sp. 4-A2]
MPGTTGRAPDASASPAPGPHGRRAADRPAGRRIRPVPVRPESPARHASGPRGQWRRQDPGVPGHPPLWKPCPHDSPGPYVYLRRHPKRRCAGVIPACAAAAALLLALTACSGTPAGGTIATNEQIPGYGEITTVAIAHRGAPIGLKGDDLDGKPLSLASYRGRVVAVNVWSSTCGPCRAEASGFESVFRSDQAKGVQFLGIDTRDLQLPASRAFVSTHGLTYPDFYDPDGSLLLQFPAGSVDPQSVPATLVLDRQGRIAVRVLDSMTGAELARVIAPVLAEKS